MLEFHGQMAKIEMGGSLRAPSIAQLLDQNLLSPQEATASQNLGELVRPFTNHHNRGILDPLATKRAQNGLLTRVTHGGAQLGAHGKPLRKGAELGSDPGGKGGGAAGAVAAGAGAPSIAGALTSPFMLGGGVLEALDLAENGTEDDHHSSTSASELHGNSAGSSLHSSRGPTRAGMPPPLTALKARSAARRQGSREREGGNNSGRRSSNSASPTGSARGDRSQPPTPSSSRPPSMTKTAPPGPPPVGLNHRSSAGAQQPAQRVKRFRPLNRGTTPTVHVAAGGVVANRVATQAGGGLKLPIIGAGAQQQQSAGQQSVGDRGALAPAALSAAQLASARAAAAAAAAASRPLPLQQKIQALNEAYGGGAGSARGGPSGGPQQRRLVPPPPPLNKGSAVVVRQGSRLPPAAPSQKWAQKLQAPHPQYPRAF